MLIISQMFCLKDINESLKKPTEYTEVVTRGKNEILTQGRP